MARATLFGATLLAASFGMSSVAMAALTIDDIAGMFSSYLILSIEPTGGDSTIYEVVYEDDGVAYIAYVDSDSGEFVAADEVAGGNEPAGGEDVDEDEGPDNKDDCKNGGWRDMDYRNQGQCIADFNRG
jgi:hypothetical protein